MQEGFNVEHSMILNFSQNLFFLPIQRTPLLYVGEGHGL